MAEQQQRELEEKKAEFERKQMWAELPGQLNTGAQVAGAVVSGVVALTYLNKIATYYQDMGEADKVMTTMYEAFNKKDYCNECFQGYSPTRGGAAEALAAQEGKQNEIQQKNFGEKSVDEAVEFMQGCQLGMACLALASSIFSFVQTVRACKRAEEFAHRPELLQMESKISELKEEFNEFLQQLIYDSNNVDPRDIRCELCDLKMKVLELYCELDLLLHESKALTAELKSLRSQGLTQMTTSALSVTVQSVQLGNLCANCQGNVWLGGATIAVYGLCLLLAAGQTGMAHVTVRELAPKVVLLQQQKDDLRKLKVDLESIINVRNSAKAVIRDKAGALADMRTAARGIVAEQDQPAFAEIDKL